jgi:hypothetical protein
VILIMTVDRLALTFCLLLSSAAFAQQQPPSSLEGRWPGGDPLKQQQPQQRQQPVRERAPLRDIEEAAPKIKPQPQPARVVACSGIFAKDSSHIKLATFVGADNITWTQVPGPEGSRLNATVLYPRDPKRRLEVLWNIEAARSDTQLIVINGQSSWVGPKGLKLGMPLAAIEKLNGRPFTIRSFGGETGGMVTSWDGGGLSGLPGGCKMGVRFVPDSKAPPPTEELAGGKNFPSSHPSLKTLAPIVAEIIIGY